MSKARALGSGDAFMAIAVLAWGVNFPVAKMVLGEMPPMVFSATRYFAAALFLFSLVLLRGDRLAIDRKEAVQLAGLGLLGIAMFQGCWAYGLNLTTASKASILVSTTPLFGAFISGFLGQWPSGKGWFGIVISLLGVVLIVNNSLTEITVGGGTLAGDIMILGAAALWAIYTSISAPMLRKRGPLLVTAWGMFFGAIILWGVALPEAISLDWGTISAKGWAGLCFTAIFGAALGFFWYYAGVVRLGLTRGMIYAYLIPVIAVITATLFFGETISLIQIAGAVVVLGGIALTRTS